MKNLVKRGLSLLMVLVMCLSLLPAMQTTASAAVQNVTYVTGSTSQYSKYSNIIKNWGVRGVTATFLSQNAAAFYTGDNTYANFSVMDGATSTSDVPSSELYLALQDFMTSNHTSITSYDATRDLFAFTDCQNSGLTSDSISCFYSAEAIGPEWDSGSTWNREHIWPKSKCIQEKANDGSDIMMLRPSKSNINSSRGNTAFGDSSGYYDPNKNSTTYDQRGDVARILLYNYVRWGNTGNMWGTSGVIESKDVLLDWMEADPVDTWELGRNDSVQSITGTRNVFVDYPELAFALFNEEVPADYTTPSGNAMSAGDSYTVTFKQNGATKGTATSPVTLPAHYGDVPSGYNFEGWVAYTVDNDTTKPTVYEAGASFSPTTDTVLHALYSVESAGGSGDYVKVTAAPADWSGTYLIVYEGGKIAMDGSLSTLDAVGNGETVAISNNKISATSTIDAISFTIAPYSSGYSIQSASGQYIGNTSDANALKTGSSAILNTLSMNDDGSVNIVSASSYLRYNAASNQTRFRYYKSSTYTAQKAIALYVKESGSAATYTTSTCAHTSTVNKAAVPATCENPGTEAGVWCNNCESFIEGGAPISVLGHDYDAVVTPPTTTAQGYTTYTCKNDSTHSYVADYVDALSYTVSFSVPAGVTKPDTIHCNSTAFDLPTPEGTPNGEHDYIFAGWATTAVNNVTERPEMFIDKYAATGDITLIAVYSYSIGGSGDGSFTLHSGDLVDGDYLLVYDGGALRAEDANDDDRLDYTEVTIENDAVRNPAAELIWHITISGETVTLYNEAVSKYAASTGAKNKAQLLAGADDTKAQWTVEAADGTYDFINVANAANEVNKTLRRNGTYGFACYATATGGALSLYKASGSVGTAYYTSVISGSAPEEPEEVTYKVSFQVPNHAGVNTPAVMVSGEAGITLPTPAAPSGYTFEGWAAASVDKTDSKPTLLTGTYVPTANTTLYAVYSYEEENASGGSGDYVKVTSAPADWSGDYVIVYEAGNLIFNGSLSTFDAVSNYKQVTISNNTISAAEADAYKFTIATLGAGYSIKGTSGKYIGNGSNSNALTTGASALLNTLSMNNDGSVNIIGSGGAYLRYNATSGQTRFRYYKSSTYTGQKAIALYAKQAGGTVSTTYYTSDIDLGATEDGTLSFKGVNLTLKDAQYLNFNALQSVVDQYENVYAVLEADGKQTAVVTTPFEHTDDSGNVRYNYSFQDLTILDFGLEVKATLYGTKDGKLYKSPTVSYSLLKYCNTAIDKGTADATPCAYLLKYVQAAEEYKNVAEADRITVSENLENSLKAEIDDAKAMQTVAVSQGEQVKIKGQYLQMEARLALEVKILVADSNMDTSLITVEATYMDTEGKEITKEYAFADLAAGDEAGIYVVSFNELYATQMSDFVRFTVKVNGSFEAALDTSIESYCTAISEGTYSASMQALAARIFQYGVAAKAEYAS